MEGILSFLTPHDDSRTFLLLILFVFFSGVVLAGLRLFKFWTALDDAIDPYIENAHGVAEEEPEAYLTRSTGIEASLRMLSPFPSVLVTIGILGTFIGIGMAISEAIPALEQDGDVKVVQDALKALLSAVKFKFQTSAYGILASLIFVGFESAISWFMYRNVEQRSRDLWMYRVELASRMAEDLAQGIEKGFRSMGESLKAGLEQMSATTLSMQAETKALSGGVKTLGLSVALFGEQITASTQALSESSGKLGQLGTDIDASLIRVASTLASSGQEQNEQTKKALKRMTDTMEVALENMQTSLNKSLESSRLSQERSMAHLLGGQQQAASQLQETMSRSLTTLQRSISSFSESQEKGLEELKSYQNDASTALVSLDKTLKKFERQSERMMNIAEKLSGSAQMPEPPPSRSNAAARRTSTKPTADTSADFL